MRFSLSKILVVSLMLAGACASSTPKATAPSQAGDTASAEAAPARKGLQIKLVTVYVDDQDKALTFYTDVLGFEKKDDFSNEGFRWLTVTDGVTELQLALNNDPAANAFQQAMFQKNQPAIMFFTNDLKAEHERMKAKGAEFTQAPTDVTYAMIATVKDGVGNYIQITELQR